MSDDTVRIGPGQPSGQWGPVGAPAQPDARVAGCCHAYPLVERDPSLKAATRLLLATMPYALARFGVLLGATVATIVWLVWTFGIGAWLGTHIASPIGWAWAILWIVAFAFAWQTLLRYFLHLMECGHVAVLTELITRGAIGNGTEGMFAYGRRVVTARFGEVSALFGLHALVRGVIGAFHRTLDFIGEMLPIPGLSGIASIVDLILRAATRYLDKVIFSYDLARNDADVWRASREGLVYYCQNARPLLKTAVWVVVLDRALTVAMWFVLLAPAGLVALILPASVRDMGAIITLLIGALLAWNVRSAFLKPLFLIMMMIRFHTTVEGQPINAAWDSRLAEISDKFRDLGRRVTAAPSWPGEPAPFGTRI